MSGRRIRARSGITRRSATARLVGGATGASIGASLGSSLAASPALAQQPASAPPAHPTTAPDRIRPVTLPPGTDRAFMQADGAASWLHLHGRTDPQTGYYAGWTQARRRVLADWSLLANGSQLTRSEANVTVTPSHTERHWPARGVRENSWLVPGAAALVIEVQAPTGTRLGLEPVGCGPPMGDMLAAWQAQDPAGGVFGRFVHLNQRLEMLTREHVVEGDGALIVFIHADTVADLAQRATAVAAALTDSLARQPASAPPAERAAQIAAATSFAGDNDFAQALQWTQATLGQLTSTQQGAGLYAGLPWFDDFWGRDTFISFVGTYLIPGRFDEAFAVLESFARLQDTDPNSRTFGRIPNRARPDEIIYNTADGTPRWVNAIVDYVAYTSDVGRVRRLWPAVRRAWQGALRNWVDADGLLLHDDADTWMDAKENGTRPYSPRGNRACDIQALWVLQASGTESLARFMGDASLEAACRAMTARIDRAVARLFFNRATGQMADRIGADGQPDFSLRPNVLMARAAIVNQDLDRVVCRQALQALLFPWGVASLAPTDSRFHPWHEPAGLWPKDEAYHNGTIWPWLNGPACDALFDHGEIGLAWTLIRRWAATALTEGTIGCQPECRDAFPRPGQDEGQPSGTWQQAWSGAELVRVVRERLIGLRPWIVPGIQKAEVEWVIDPNLLPSFPGLSETVRLGADSVYRIEVLPGGRRVELHRIAGTPINFDFSDDIWRRQGSSDGVDGPMVLVRRREVSMRGQLQPLDFVRPTDPEATPVVQTWRARQSPGVPPVSGDSP